MQPDFAMAAAIRDNPLSTAILLLRARFGTVMGTLDELLARKVLAYWYERVQEIDGGADPPRPGPREPRMPVQRRTDSWRQNHSPFRAARR